MGDKTLNSVPKSKSVVVRGGQGLCGEGEVHQFAGAALTK